LGKKEWGSFTGDLEGKVIREHVEKSSVKGCLSLLGNKGASVYWEF